MYFCTHKIYYLGYIIDQYGIHTTEEKVKAISNAPIPENVKQLQAFLGVLNFYRRFLPNVSTILEPLNPLLPSVLN